jgi:hypothetical protein
MVSSLHLSGWVQLGGSLWFIKFISFLKNRVLDIIHYDLGSKLEILGLVCLRF